MNLLSYKNYLLSMAEELNNNGFMDNGKKYEVKTNINGEYDSSFYISFIMSIKDKKAIDFLKEIGLLNNGRCPLTGLMISSSTKVTFTSKHNSSITFDINSTWYEFTRMRGKWGCLVSPAIIIVGIIFGIVGGFDVYAFCLIGLGLLLTIIFGIYVSAIGGDYLNNRSLSNAIELNPVTLFKILKMERSGEKMDIINASKHDIPKTDFTTFIEWRDLQIAFSECEF